MLEVARLVAGYGGKPVARLPSVSIPAGEAAVIAGPSGSGKTTVLLAIAGLAETLGGTVSIAGVNVADLRGRRRDRHRGRSIGLIFQDLHLVPGLSALDNMLLAPFAGGAKPDRARAVALLERLGVADRRDAHAEKLSRGQAQRVAIARALMMRPQLILADEPTASLDDDACGSVVALLLETARESGAALMVATHDARVRARIPAIVMAEAA